MLVDLRGKSAELTGADAEKWLQEAGIICNKNGIPEDPRPPKFTSGVRLGTPALTTRGMMEADMATVAAFIDRVLTAGLAGPADLERVSAAVRSEIRALCERFPMPH
jgi:glycine hydroxymethyltransferase